MATRLTGIFDTVSAAERARDALVAEGIARERITLSASQTSDGIAAEAPGETYENQAGEDRASVERGRFGSAIRSAVCALTVDSTGEEERVGAILRSRGAREVMRPPA
ncbi:MAG TPA: hypothetical protein VF038_00125 [Usitatibacter sp.]|jgi:hypothetical protein